MHFKFPSIIVLVLAMAISSTEAASWEALPTLPVASGNFVCGALGDDLVVAGGITWKNDTKIWSDQIWRFDTKKSTWSEVGKLPHPLAYPACGQTADEIYFAGGSDGKKTVSEIGRLDRQFQFQKIGEVPLPLVYSASTLAGGKLFVVAGGADVVDLTTLTNVFYSIDVKSGHVERLADFPGGKLIVPTAAASKGRIYVFTGAFVDSTNKAINVNSAFVYSIGEAKWSAIKSFPFTVRGLNSCVLDERYIFLAGGYKEDFTDEAFIYDTKTNSYSKTRPLPYRGMVSFVRIGDNLYCFGGEDKMRHRSDLAYRISWKALLR
jgi:N-acetylneuraminic acid mutarotase